MSMGFIESVSTMVLLKVMPDREEGTSSNKVSLFSSQEAKTRRITRGQSHFLIGKTFAIKVMNYTLADMYANHFKAGGIYVAMLLLTTPIFKYQIVNQLSRGTMRGK